MNLLTYLKQLKNLFNFSLIEENPQLPPVGVLDKYPEDIVEQYEQSKKLMRRRKKQCSTTE